ncbi:MAG: hypothetical protein RL460_266, partial [Actinomycetota bacterium]
MSIAKFPLPDVGEGLTEAEIVSWKVAVGDHVSVNQTICEIETAKSIVELPCPFAGEVTELLAKEGETVEVGNPIIAVRVLGASPIPTLSEPDAPAGAVEQEADTGAEYKLPTLVGYGDSGEAKSRRRRAVAAVAPVTTAIPVSMVRAMTATDNVMAKPPIRKLAKELGVDLGSVSGTGVHGEITREDVIGSASQASVLKNLTTPQAPS